jgi:hypothetical protein
MTGLSASESTDERRIERCAGSEFTAPLHSSSALLLPMMMIDRYPLMRDCAGRAIGRAQVSVGGVFNEGGAEGEVSAGCESTIHSPLASLTAESDPI